MLTGKRYTTSYTTLLILVPASTKESRRPIPFMRTHPVTRAIRVSHTACKHDFRRDPRSHSWSEFLIFDKYYINKFIFMSPNTSSTLMCLHSSEFTAFTTIAITTCSGYILTREQLTENKRPVYYAACKGEYRL